MLFKSWGYAISILQYKPALESFSLEKTSEIECDHESNIWVLLCPSLQQGNNGQLGDKCEKLLNLMPKFILGMIFDSKTNPFTVSSRNAVFAATTQQKGWVCML